MSESNQVDEEFHDTQEDFVNENENGEGLPEDREVAAIVKNSPAEEDRTEDQVPDITGTEYIDPMTTSMDGIEELPSNEETQIITTEEIPEETPENILEEENLDVGENIVEAGKESNPSDDANVEESAPTAEEEKVVADEDAQPVVDGEETSAIEVVEQSQGGEQQKDSENEDGSAVQENEDEPKKFELQAPPEGKRPRSLNELDIPAPESTTDSVPATPIADMPGTPGSALPDAINTPSAVPQTPRSAVGSVSALAVDAIQTPKISEPNTPFAEAAPGSVPATPKSAALTSVPPTPIGEVPATPKSTAGSVVPDEEFADAEEQQQTPATPGVESAVGSVPPTPGVESAVGSVPPTPGVEPALGSVPPTPRSAVGSVPPTPGVESAVGSVPPTPGVESAVGSVPPTPRSAVGSVPPTPGVESAVGSVPPTPGVESAVGSVPPTPRSAVGSVPPTPLSGVGSVPPTPRSAVGSVPPTPKSAVGSVPPTPKDEEYGTPAGSVPPTPKESVPGTPKSAAPSIPPTPRTARDEVPSTPKSARRVANGSVANGSVPGTPTTAASAKSKSAFNFDSVPETQVENTAAVQTPAPLTPVVDETEREPTPEQAEQIEEIREELATEPEAEPVEKQEVEELKQEQEHEEEKTDIPEKIKEPETSSRGERSSPPPVRRSEVSSANVHASVDHISYDKDSFNQLPPPRMPSSSSFNSWTPVDRNSYTPISPFVSNPNKYSSSYTSNNYAPTRMYTSMFDDIVSTGAFSNALYSTTRLIERSRSRARERKQAMRSQRSASNYYRYSSQFPAPTRTREYSTPPSRAVSRPPSRSGSFVSFMEYSGSKNYELSRSNSRSSVYDSLSRSGSRADLYLGSGRLSRVDSYVRDLNTTYRASDSVERYNPRRYNNSYNNTPNMTSSLYESRIGHLERSLSREKINRDRMRHEYNEISSKLNQAVRQMELFRSNSYANVRSSSVSRANVYTHLYPYY